MTSTPEHAPEPDADDGRQLSVADHQLRKTRLMARKCHSCIFRRGDLMRLGTERLAEIVNQAIDTNGFIVCHNSLPYGPYPQIAPAICRGFYDRYHTQALQVAARLWGFVEVNPPDQSTTASGNNPGPPGASPPHP